MHSSLALEIIEELVISQKFLTAFSTLSIHFFNVYFVILLLETFLFFHF